MAGIVIMVIGVEAVHVPIEYTTVAVPAVTPVTTPPAEIVAEPVPFVIDHVPPPTEFVNAGVVLPVQTVAAPPPIAAGVGLTVKLPAEVPVPPEVVTAIVPVVAPTGTVAVICVAELTVYVIAAVPLNVTAVAPVKFVPIIVIDAPIQPDVGVKEVIVGGENM